MILRIDGQWLYAPYRGLTAIDWRPIALIDRHTGHVYALVPGLTNAEAHRLVWTQEGR